MFEGFTKSRAEVNGVSIAYRIGGKGPGLLLLHGFPQTHVMWHKVAPALAKHFTVVAADLRGYGDSGKIAADPEHINHSKREVAKDQVQLMAKLGFPRFAVMAHDRGARVAHRMAVDHPQAVSRAVFLDIAPTLAMYSQTTEAFARSYWHWFFLIRPAPLPETLLENYPEMYIRITAGSRSAGMKPFTSEALSEYIRCMKIPGTASAMCEDYRASAAIDLEHDKADIAAKRFLTCPLQAFWGKDGIIGSLFDPLSEWRKVATDVQCKGLPSGHYIAEEIPEILLDEALPFLLKDR